MKTLEQTWKETKDAGAPVILNLGMGVDSTSMLVGLKRAGLIPDLIHFADTGSEKPETYEYIWTIQPWLEANGFPGITIVWRSPAKVSYHSLEENCLANETLPSMAFGMKSCSLKWKAEIMDRFLLGVTRGPNKCKPWLPPQCLPGKSFKNAAGKRERPAPQVKALKLIGYDNGPSDSRRSVGRTEDACFQYFYPLRQWGWAREDCIAAIREEGLEQPLKSACFFCPASKKWEVLWLAGRHPELFLRAVKMEDTARNGKNGFTSIKGLGRNWSWREFGETEGFLEGTTVTMPAAELLAKAAALKPAYEANDCGSCGSTDSELVQLGGK